MSNNCLFMRPFKVIHKSVAHNIENSERTKDIHINENVDFSIFTLSSSVTEGLKACGFVKPSPIQYKAIPYGKCGMDLILQAKSGTGKTCVFTVLALEAVSLDVLCPQVLILAPTREVAVQIMQVISEIGCRMNGLKVECFIGGTSVDGDIKKAGNCHIVVGTPGRVKHLVESTDLDISSLKLFVLDEADKLLSESFLSDIMCIRKQVSSYTQIIASSATFPDYVQDTLNELMRSPIHVCPETDKIILHGVRQFVMRVKFHGSSYAQYKIKARQLIDILSAIPFKQCLVFSNCQSRAQAMCNRLSSEGWPAKWIGSLQDQPTRLKTLNDFRKFHCRVLLSTDLTARGIDVENVNLVINFDVPYSGPNYLHRIGRSGRYGSYGIAITLVNEVKEFPIFKKMLGSISGSDFSVALLPPESLSEKLWTCDVSNFEQIYGVDPETYESQVNNNKYDEDILLCKSIVNEQPALHEEKMDFRKVENLDEGKCKAIIETNSVEKYANGFSEEKSTFCNGKEKYGEEVGYVIEKEETVLKDMSKYQKKMNLNGFNEENNVTEKECKEETILNNTKNWKGAKPDKPTNNKIHLLSEEIKIDPSNKQVEKMMTNNKERHEKSKSEYINKVNINMQCECVDKIEHKENSENHHTKTSKSESSDVMICANNISKLNITDLLEVPKVEASSENVTKFSEQLQMQEQIKKFCMVPKSFDDVVQSYQNFQEYETVDIKSFVISDYFSQNLSDSINISVKCFECLSKKFGIEKLRKYKRNDLSEEELLACFIRDSMEDTSTENKVSDISYKCQNDFPETCADIIPVNSCANAVGIYRHDMAKIEDSVSATSESAMFLKTEGTDSSNNKPLQDDNCHNTELPEVSESKNLLHTSAVNNACCNGMPKVEKDSTAAEEKLLTNTSSASSSICVEQTDADKLLPKAVIWCAEYKIPEPPKKCHTRINSNDLDYDEILSDYETGNTEESISSDDDDDSDSYSDDSYSDSSDSEVETEENDSEEEEGATTQQYDYSNSCTLPSLDYPSYNYGQTQEEPQPNSSHTENYHFEGGPDCTLECAHPYLEYSNWRTEMLKVKQYIQYTEYMKLVSSHYHK